MKNKLVSIGEELEKGVIPKDLEFMKEFGKQLKENPAKYAELRNALAECGSDNDQLNILKGFAVSEDRIRKLVPDLENSPYALGTIVITITITITLTPGTAH